MTHEEDLDLDDASGVADRLDELADTAELMGDVPTALRLREHAHRHRLDCMNRRQKHPHPDGASASESQRRNEAGPGRS